MKTVFLAALALALTAGGPALADSDHHHRHGHKHGHGRHHDEGGRVVVERHVVHHYAGRSHGDPPWARAGDLPYGFGRGTCDRGLISGEMMGDVIGGVAGGVLGSRIGRGSGRTAATIGGTIAGVLVGGSVGRGMDRVDRDCVAGALEYLPDDRRIAWVGDGGGDYRVQPVRSWRVEDGRYCREYQTSTVIGGRRQQAYGTACRQPDGAWEIVE